MAKKITLGILIFVLIVGVVLLFIKSIDMERYAVLLSSFAPFYLALIASIGVNSGIEKIKEKECGEKA